MLTISSSTRRAAQTLAIVAGLSVMSVISATVPAWAQAGRPSTAVTVVNPFNAPVPSAIVNPSSSPVPTAIVNPSTSPVHTTDVNEPALQPFQATLFPHSSTSNQATDTVTVPAGKRLVIEYYSSQAQDLTGGAAGMVLTTTAGGGSPVEYIVYVNANNTNQVNQIARIYADPGSTVEAFSFNANSASSTAGFVTISGHLVNLPALP